MHINVRDSVSVLIHFQGKTVQEPFHCSLGHAIQWFDILQVKIKYWVKATLANSHMRLPEAQLLDGQQAGHLNDPPSLHEPTNAIS